MMRRALLTLGFATLGGLAAGWFTALPPGASAPALEAASQASLTPLHGGAAASAAGARITQLSFGVPPAVELDTPPPPPDVAVTFRRELTAIEHTPTGAVAWVVDWSQAGGRRALRRGDIYQDGWRVATVGEQSVDLRRAQEVRHIDLFSAPPETVP